jgi:hypothetical protein
MNRYTRITLTLVFSLLVVPHAATAKAHSRIRAIDFNNFTFRQFWGSRPIRLRNGKLEFESQGCHTEYKLTAVNYVDLTGDRIAEALVHVEDFTACGSSGVSDYYYIYTIQKGRLRLLWRFGTGSEGIAGLKEFKLDGRVLVFELFGKYRIAGPKFVDVGQQSTAECCPDHYSHVTVSWDGQKFRQRSLKIYAFPYKSITEYYHAVGYTRR